MRVNVKKTQILCISPNNGQLTSAAFIPRGSDEAICSGETMKLVGFTFGAAPTVDAHVEYICWEFRKKIWMLFHLHESGIRGSNLYKLYCCYIRSRMEYMSAAYHPMLLKGHRESLEKLQRFALRICFGDQQDIRATMATMGIETLEARRTRRVDSFVAKAAANPRFSHWFPLRGERAQEQEAHRGGQNQDGTKIQRSPGVLQKESQRPWHHPGCCKNRGEQ